MAKLEAKNIKKYFEHAGKMLPALDGINRGLYAVIAHPERILHHKRLNAAAPEGCDLLL